VNIRVSADATLPPVSLLQITLRQPGRQLSGLYRSLSSDTDSGAEPFRFPVTIAFNFVGASQAPTTVTVDALGDSTEYHQVASGTASVEVKPQRAVDTDLMLSAATVTPPVGDGGADDAGASPDAAADEPPDADEADEANEAEVQVGVDGDVGVDVGAGSEADAPGAPGDAPSTMAPLASPPVRQ
jgi:hypothetical protein